MAPKEVPSGAILVNFGVFSGPSGHQFWYFFGKGCVLDAGQDFHKLFRDFMSNFSRSDSKNCMVFTRQNACRHVSTKYEF